MIGRAKISIEEEQTQIRNIDATIQTLFQKVANELGLGRESDSAEFQKKLEFDFGYKCLLTRHASHSEAIDTRLKEIKETQAKLEVEKAAYERMEHRERARTAKHAVSILKFAEEFKMEIRPCLHPSSCYDLAREFWSLVFEQSMRKYKGLSSTTMWNLSEVFAKYDMWALNWLENSFVDFSFGNLGDRGDRFPK